MSGMQGAVAVATCTAGVRAIRSALSQAVAAPSGWLGMTPQPLPYADMASMTAWATRRPSVAALMMPPAYPAPSPAG